MSSMSASSLSDKYYHSEEVLLLLFVVIVSRVTLTLTHCIKLPFLAHFQFQGKLSFKSLELRLPQCLVQYHLQRHGLGLAWDPYVGRCHSQ